MFNEDTQREKIIRISILFGIGLIMVIFFANIFFDVFTVHDTLVHYVWARTGDYWESSWIVAVEQGRISYVLINLLSILLYAANSIWIYNLISFGTLTFCAFSLGKMVKRYTNTYVGLLCVALFFALAQADGQHNFFVAYVGLIGLQGAIAFVLFAMERLFTYYYKEKTNKYLMQSAVLLTIGSMAYEALIFLSILFFLIAVIENNDEKNLKFKIRNIIIELRFHVIFMLIYLFIYFIFRVFWPSVYDPTTIGNLNLRLAFKTMITYSFGMMPGAHFFRIMRQINVWEYINVISIIKVLLVGAIYNLTVIKSKLFSNLKQVIYILIMAMGVFLPCLIMGFTKRHVEWVQNGVTSYGASYYSYYFIIIVIALFCVILYNKTSFKKMFLILSTIIIVSLAFVTDVSNRYYADIFKSGFDRCSAFNKLLESNPFKEIEEGSTIYVEGSSGIHGSFYYVDELANAYTGKHYNFVTDFADVSYDADMYMIKAVDNAWVLGKINEKMEAESVYVFMHKPMKEYSIVGKIAKTQVLKINGIEQGIFDTTFIIGAIGTGAEYETITGESIRMDSVQISEGHLFNNAVIQIDLADGFYGREDGKVWSKGESCIKISNLENLGFKVRIFILPAVKPCDLKVYVDNELFDYKLNQEGISVEFDVDSTKTEIEVKFECDGEILSSIEDEREKVMLVYEPIIEF